MRVLLQYINFWYALGCEYKIDADMMCAYSVEIRLAGETLENAQNYRSYNSSAS